MTGRLLLDEHYAAEIADRLCVDGYDIVAVVGDAELRALPDTEIFRWAAGRGRRIVTENIKDFRPLLMRAYTTGEAIAPLLLVSPRRFARGGGDRTEVIVKALTAWLHLAEPGDRPDEDWLM
jgi:hypothetical protein